MKVQRIHYPSFVRGVKHFMSNFSTSVMHELSSPDRPQDETTLIVIAIPRRTSFLVPCAPSPRSVRTPPNPSQAALLLETLLLDSLVARPDFSASLSRSSVAGRAGTVASPRRGYTSSGRESTIVAGGGGGVLSEADQRILQV